MLANLGANFLVNGATSAPPQRMGNAHVNIVPYQVFETAPKASGERDFVIVAVGNDGQFAKLSEVIGHADWSKDPRFVRNQDRVRHRSVLVPMIADVLIKRGKYAWLEAMEAAKVPCGPINNLAEVFADPHIQARQMVDHWQHGLGVPLDLVASPMKLSQTPVRRDLPPPSLGQHTDEVLKEWLGLEPSQCEALRHATAI
jgi:crotonobetainyl-CoA:carnitine CoA-transferase CaiB-like acyl-CoA transferase